MQSVLLYLRKNRKRKRDLPSLYSSQDCLAFETMEAVQEVFGHDAKRSQIVRREEKGFPDETIRQGLSVE